MTTALHDLAAEHCAAAGPCWDPVRIFLFSLALHATIFWGSLFLCQYWSAYKKLKPSDQIYFVTTIVSQAHALVSFPGAVWAIFFDGLQHDGFVFAQSPLFDFLAAYSVGYFVHDLFLVFVFPKALFGLGVVAHHLINIVLTPLTFTHITMKFLAVYGLLFEGSTLFLNPRYWMSHLGYKHTLLYTLNGLAFSVSFFIVRIVGLSYVAYMFATTKDDLTKLTQLDLITCGPGLALMTALNVFWFYRILLGLLALFSGSTKRKGE